MRQISNITSSSMLMIVLLLGIFMPSLPNLDDNDENVGCAAVLTVAPNKSVSEASHDRKYKRQPVCTTRENKLSMIAHRMVFAAITPAIVVLTQITPPLRP